MGMNTAWDFIGFDGTGGHVRIVGGRTLYEAVDYNDSRGGKLVRLARLEVEAWGLHQVNRYVDPDTPLEFVPDEATT